MRDSVFKSASVTVEALSSINGRYLDLLALQNAGIERALMQSVLNAPENAAVHIMIIKCNGQPVAAAPLIFYPQFCPENESKETYTTNAVLGSVFGLKSQKTDDSSLLHPAVREMEKMKRVLTLFAVNYAASLPGISKLIMACASDAEADFLKEAGFSSCTNQQECGKMCGQFSCPVDNGRVICMEKQLEKKQQTHTQQTHTLSAVA